MALPPGGSAVRALALILVLLAAQGSAFKQSNLVYAPLLSACRAEAVDVSDSEMQLNRKCALNQSDHNLYHVHSSYPRLSVAYQPKVFRYSASIVPESVVGLIPGVKYRLSICPMWGLCLADFYSAPRLMCTPTGDIMVESNASINNSPLKDCYTLEHTADSGPWPSIPWNSISFASSGPARLYDALLFTATLCIAGDPSPVYRNNGFSLIVQNEFIFPWGQLHAEMWSELMLLIVLVLPKLALAAWFYRRCMLFRDSVMRIQWLYLGSLGFSIVSTFAYIGYLGDANISGQKTIFPTSKATVGMNFLRTVADLFFTILVLATSKGWGVVRPRLTRVENQKIIAFTTLTFFIFALQHLFQHSVELAWMTLACDMFLIIWIFMSLKITMRDLGLSSRLDRTHKLEMYSRLHRLLWISMQIWFMSIFLAIVIVVFVFESMSGLFVGYQIPPTMSWDLAILVLQLGFGFIWAPSTLTALYSYSFLRADQEEQDEVNVGLEEGEMVE